MKVKLFAQRGIEDLETAVNKFLETLLPEQIIDIKYSSSDDFSEVMIVYKA